MVRVGAAKAVFVVVTGVVTAVSGVQFREQRHYRTPIVAGPSVARMAALNSALVGCSLNT